MVAASENVVAMVNMLDCVKEYRENRNKKDRIKEVKCWEKDSAKTNGALDPLDMLVKTSTMAKHCINIPPGVAKIPPAFCQGSKSSWSPR